MPVLQAARVDDQIEHTSALNGLIIGAVAGVALAVAVVAIVGTGGVAAVAIGAGIAAAGAGGALSGAYIGEVIPSSPKGPIITGSPNTFVGAFERGAARAGIDKVNCKDHGLKLLAQGSSTVFVNQMMFVRRTEKAVCSGRVRDGCSTVLIGGDTAIVPGLEIEEEIPPWLRNTLTAIMWGGIILATGGAAAVFGIGAALGGLAGGLLGGVVLGKVGGAIGRACYGELGGRIGEVMGGTVGGFLGGLAGARAGAFLEAQLPAGTIAKLPGQTQMHMDARQEVATSFYEQHGQTYDPTINNGAGGMRPMTEAEIQSHVEGINLEKPVSVTNAPEELQQWGFPGKQGSYYAKPGTAPTEVGVGDIGTDLSGTVGPREAQTYTFEENTPALKSTAAPMNDSRSVPGTVQPTSGGKTQYYIPDKGAATPVGDPVPLPPDLQNPVEPYPLTTDP